MEIIQEILGLTKALEEKNGVIQSLQREIIEEKNRTKAAEEATKELKKSVQRFAKEELNDVSKDILIKNTTHCYRVDVEKTKSWFAKQLMDGEEVSYYSVAYADSDEGKIYDVSLKEAFYQHEFLYGLERPTVEATPLGKVRDIFPEYFDDKGKQIKPKNTKKKEEDK